MEKNCFYEDNGKTYCDYCNRDISDDDTHDGNCEWCCPQHELKLVEWTDPKSIHSSSDDLTFGCENCSAIWYGGYNPS